MMPIPTRPRPETARPCPPSLTPGVTSRASRARPDAVRAALDAAGLLDPLAEEGCLPGPPWPCGPGRPVRRIPQPRSRCAPPWPPRAGRSATTTGAPSAWGRGPPGLRPRPAPDAGHEDLRSPSSTTPTSWPLHRGRGHRAAAAPRGGAHRPGVRPDGRLWFTMRGRRPHPRGRHRGAPRRGGRRVRGPSAGPAPAGRGPAACAAVAFAHERGVVRDLKPSTSCSPCTTTSSSSTGASPDDAERDLPDAGGVAAIQTSRNTPSCPTQIGQVAGTPAYMRPSRPGARSTRSARGRLLPRDHPVRPSSERRRRTASPPPATTTCRGRDPADVDVGPADGAPDLDGEAPAAGTPRDGDAGLPSGWAICWRASPVRPDRCGRPRGALQARLDGAQQRQATASRARDKVPVREALAEEAQRMARAASQGLRARPAGAHRSEAPLWAPQDEAAAASRRANLASHEQEMPSTARSPGSPTSPTPTPLADTTPPSTRARANPAGSGAGRGAAAPAHRRPAAPAPRPRGAPRRLDGRGLLTLHTDPPGATVTIHRLEEVSGAWCPPRGAASSDSLDAVELPAGSYLCELRHPDRATATYLVQIKRQAHWDGRPRAKPSPAPCPSSAPTASPAARYVPAGPMLLGGHGGVPDDLAAAPVGRGLHHPERPSPTRTPPSSTTPRSTATAAAGAPQPPGEPGSLPAARTATGRFELTIDPMGTVDPAMPAVYVDLAAARAYAAWLSARTNRRWRLPTELECAGSQGWTGGPPWGYGPSPPGRSACCPDPADRS